MPYPEFHSMLPATPDNKNIFGQVLRRGERFLTPKQAQLIEEAPQKFERLDGTAPFETDDNYIVSIFGIEDWTDQTSNDDIKNQMDEMVFVYSKLDAATGNITPEKMFIGEGLSGVMLCYSMSCCPSDAGRNVIAAMKGKSGVWNIQARPSKTALDKGKGMEFVNGIYLVNDPGLKKSLNHVALHAFEKRFPNAQTHICDNHASMNIAEMAEQGTKLKL